MKTVMLSLGLLACSAMAMESSNYSDFKQDKEEQSSSGSEQEEARNNKKITRKELLSAITALGVDIKNVKQQLDVLSQAYNHVSSASKKSPELPQLRSNRDNVECSDDPNHEIRPDYVTVGICALTLVAVFFGR